MASLEHCLELYKGLFTPEEMKALHVESRVLAIKQKIPFRQAMARIVEARKNEAQVEYNKVEKVIEKHLGITEKPSPKMEAVKPSGKKEEIAPEPIPIKEPKIKEEPSPKLTVEESRVKKELASKPISKKPKIKEQPAPKLTTKEFVAKERPISKPAPTKEPEIKEVVKKSKGATLGFGPTGEIQRLYETLVGKRKSREKLRLGKYARSINVKKKPQSMEEFTKELAAITPEKKTQTWAQTEQKSKKILKNLNKRGQLIKEAKKGKALNAEELDALNKMYVGGHEKLKELIKDLPPLEKMSKAEKEHFKEQTNQFKENLFKITSDANSEAGRALNILKKSVALRRTDDAIRKIISEKGGLNSRQKELFKKLNTEDPVAVKRFLDTIEDPKLKDYFYEYWYNSILSGIPTHIVNVASNTLWAAFQLGAHRPFRALIDIPISKLTGQQRKYYINETIPALLGYKKAFKKGMEGAREMLKKGNISEFETKWEREFGSSVAGAFERSLHKGLRKLAPYISAPTKALRAMDVWANTMAYDAEIAALARRMANQKGLKGEARETFERNLILKPTKEMREEATKFAKHLTFTDDPGKFTEWIIQGRSKIPFTRLIIPFVNTVANLTKRGIEMTPVVGLSLAKGKSPAEVIAKQIEGAILGLYILHKCDKGEILGPAPDNKTEREAFYRQGKKPWSIKIGDKWYSYRRIEPFNTAIASTAIAYNALKEAKDETTWTEIFGNMTEGLLENLVDSSYMQGVTNILDRYGGRKGMIQRTLASFVPFSGFWRSVNRAYDVATEGKTLVRDTKSLLGAFSQVIPGLTDKVPAKLTVWGEEIPIEGGIFRQWLPYKWSKEKDDPTEKMLEKLGLYPGLPSKHVTINKKKVELPDDIYRDYCISYGHKAKKRLDKLAEQSYFKNLPATCTDDNAECQLKKAYLNRILTRIRSRELMRAKLEYIKKKRDLKP